MAWNKNYNQTGEPEETQIGKFNAGLYQIQRIHELQAIINRASMNPIAFNPEHGVYNYQLIFRSTNLLLREATGKLTDEERKTAIEYRKHIRKEILKNPIHKSARNARNGKHEVTYNEINWRYIQKLLEFYDELMRLYLDKHGLSNPDQGEEAMF